MRLLIIEDNIDLSNFIKQGLEKMGFQVDVAHDGHLGYEKIYINAYDAILLDLNLPDIDGLEVLKSIRSNHIDCPVLIITARDEIVDRALGLDLGADDYIVKPFQLIELRARIQAVIRRFHGRANPEIVIGGLTINPSSRTVNFDGKSIVLASKEFDILEYLAVCYPSVVSSEKLVEHIYDENFDPFSSVLRVHLARLRKKLHEGSSKDLLKTIRGKGYVLCNL